MTGKKTASTGKGINHSNIEWENIFNAIGHPALILDPQHKIIAVNSTTLKLTGKSESDILGKKCYEIFHGKDAVNPPEGCPMEKMLKSNQLETTDMEMEAFGGFFLVSCTPVFDEQGNLQKVVHIATDITDRKQAEKALQVSEEKYRDLFENAIDPIFLLDAEHNFVDMNKRAVELFGYSREEFLHMKVFDIIPPEQVPASSGEFEKLHAMGKYEKFVGKIRTKDGRWLDIEVSSSAIVKDGKIIGSRDIVRDITNRKRAEKMLKERGELLERIFDTTHFSIVYLDRDFNFIRVNKAYADAYGYPPEFFSGKNHFDLYHHEENEAIFRHVAETGTQFTIYAKPFEYPDHPEWGVSYWDWTLYPVKSVDGTVEGLILILLDVTRNKKAEDKILRERDFMNAVINSLPSIFYMFDQKGKFLRWNKNFERVSEYSPQEITLMSPLEFFDGPDKVLIQERIQETFVKGISDAEAVFVSKSGGKTPYYFTGQTIQIDGKSCLIGMGIDITEQKKLHEQLRQAQKMESIGHLAGGVAHDFNNILSAIVGYAHLTLMKLKDDDPLRMNIEHILTASDKAANLTQSLLAFSRKQLIIPKPVNINNIVFNIKKILDRIIGEDIDLKVNTAVNDLIVTVDKGQIEHALLNLATNARDAMPEGGALTITTEEVEIDEKFIQMHQEGTIGKYAVITVADTGMGMDEKTKGNIFEPFFTTKEVGKGTGLGLAMVYGTIKQHNGFINVYSEPGQGTTFRIYLPLAKSGVQVTEKRESGSMPTGTETILLVEDDKAVRSSIKALLEELGYKVIEAADGAQAITICRENIDFVQLVISDVIMPRQSGKEVYDELKKIRPDIKVLFISGYSADILTKKGIVGEGINFISKPINPEIFFKKIREVLDE